LVAGVVPGRNPRGGGGADGPRDDVAAPCRDQAGREGYRRDTDARQQRGPRRPAPVRQRDHLGGEARRRLGGALGSTSELPAQIGFELVAHWGFPFSVGLGRVVRSLARPSDAWLRTVPRERPSTAAISSSDRSS